MDLRMEGREPRFEDFVFSSTRILQRDVFVRLNNTLLLDGKFFIRKISIGFFIKQFMTTITNELMN